MSVKKLTDFCLGSFEDILVKKTKSNRANHLYIGLTVTLTVPLGPGALAFLQSWPEGFHRQQMVSCRRLECQVGDSEVEESGDLVESVHQEFFVEGSVNQDYLVVENINWDSLVVENVHSDSLVAVKCSP